MQTIRPSETSHKIVIDSCVMIAMKRELKNQGITDVKVYTPRRFLREAGLKNNLDEAFEEYDKTFASCKNTPCGICAIEAKADPENMRQMARELFETEPRPQSLTSEQMERYMR